MYCRTVLIIAYTPSIAYTLHSNRNKEYLLNVIPCDVSKYFNAGKYGC